MATPNFPSHLFLSSGGALFDTRAPNWTAQPVRNYYGFTFREIETVAQFKATLRAGAFAWPGCYPLYFITRDGAALSFEAAREQFAAIAREYLDDTSTGWRVVACEVNWEDSELCCDHTGRRIESAYGEAV